MTTTANNGPTVTTKKPAGAGPSLRRVASTSGGRPNRIVLHAIPGWGKTSFACHTADPIFLMVGDEDGLKKLLQEGQVPPTAHFEDLAKTWNEVLLGTQALIVEAGHGHKTFVVDAVNKAAELCAQSVCERNFGGDWDAFNAFGRGWKLVPPEWQKWIDNLSRLGELGMTVLLLAHTDMVKFTNPTGLDYSRYVPRMPNKCLWEPLEQWADMILFGELETFVSPDGGNKKATKGKAVGGQDRVIRCERTAAFDAKNRHGLPEAVPCGWGAPAAAAAFAKALAAGRAKRAAEAKGEADKTDKPADAGGEEK